MGQTIQQGSRHRELSGAPVPARLPAPPQPWAHCFLPPRAWSFQRRLRRHPPARPELLLSQALYSLPAGRHLRLPLARWHLHQAKFPEPGQAWQVPRTPVRHCLPEPLSHRSQEQPKHRKFRLAKESAMPGRLSLLCWPGSAGALPHVCPFLEQTSG